MENILIWDRYCTLVEERVNRNLEKKPLDFSLADDEILIRSYLRSVPSYASLEIEYKKQLKNPVVWQTPIWGQYLPTVSSKRLTEIMREELDLRNEILSGTNVYHMFADGTSIFKKSENTHYNYFGNVIPDPEETYTPETQATIDTFYRVDHDRGNKFYTLIEQNESADKTSLKGTGKSLHNTDINAAKKNVKDIQVFGNGNLFTLISKASSENEGWMKSTKAMFVGTGCLVQVTTQQRNPDGTYAVAEALTYVPGVEIVKTGTDDAGVVTGRKLVPIVPHNKAPEEMSMAEFIAKAKRHVESDTDKDFTEKKPSAFQGVKFVKE